MVLPNKGSKGFRRVGDGEGSKRPLFVETSSRHVNVVVRKRLVVGFQIGGILEGSQQGDSLYCQRNSRNFQVG